MSARLTPAPTSVSRLGVQTWASRRYPEAVLQETAKQLQETGEMTGKSFDEQYELWLDKVTANAQEHTARERIARERERWEKEELPSYRSRWLAERNGGEATPESGEGTPATVKRPDGRDDRQDVPEQFGHLGRHTRTDPSKGQATATSPPTPSGWHSLRRWARGRASGSPRFYPVVAIRRTLQWRLAHLNS